jgi:O-antigen ligase
MAIKKGSYAAPLFFLSLAFACLGSRLGLVAPWAFAVLAMAATGWVGSSGRVPWSWLSLPVLGYALLVAFNTLLLSPAYTPAGLYHPLLLAAAFLLARSLADRAEKAAVIAALASGVVLAVWGLVQSGLLGIARAQAIFETPATFAAVLNLFLVPALAAVLLGRRERVLLIVAALLAAALFAADSRGGLVALTAGLGAAAILGLRARLLRPRALGLVLALLAAGWIAAIALRTVPSHETTAPPTAEARVESSLSRLELYALSWNAWRERPLAGTGYLTFRNVLEQGRARVPSYGQSSETWFVHNDYLQTLQELGPLGLAALLGLTLLPPAMVYCRMAALAPAQRLPAVAFASALAAMAVHALVDFPFYIPVCLLLYGALLGALDRRLGGPAPSIAPTWSSAPWFRAARAGALALAAVVLLRPVAAEAAAELGLRQAATGDGRSAALWLGAARRIDPADWRYHWYAGQFWDVQAAQSGKREAARLAAEAYAAGFDANPLEVRNLLGKISVHRRHRALLDAPANPGTLQAWLAQAVALAPLNPAVRRELAR